MLSEESLDILTHYCELSRYYDNYPVRVTTNAYKIIKKELGYAIRGVKVGGDMERPYEIHKKKPFKDKHIIELLQNEVNALTEENDRMMRSVDKFVRDIQGL